MPGSAYAVFLRIWSADHIEQGRSHASY